MSTDRVEEEEEEVENFDWPLSFEEAQMFASLPVTQPGFNNYTKTLPNATRRRRMADQQVTVVQIIPLICLWDNVNVKY